VRIAFYPFVRTCWLGANRIEGQLWQYARQGPDLAIERVFKGNQIAPARY